MDITELSTILFDSQGPSKIGIELEIEDEDGNISPTAYTDLYEFLLHLLIIGIKKFNLIPTNTNYEYIEEKLQYYFNRINILLDLQPAYMDYNDYNDYNDENINTYCKIYIENDELKIVPNPNNNSDNYSHISNVIGIYILPYIEPVVGQKRNIADNTYGIKIKFNYIF
jgi:hypothetical protein